MTNYKHTNKEHHLSNAEIINRQQSAILILSIFATQFSTAAILGNLHKITPHFSSINSMYYVITAVAAIVQAGFSDDFGRKRHLLISCISAVISGLIFLCTLLIISSSTSQSAIVSLVIAALAPFVLGIAGNSIPIARGCLVDLDIHDFRTTMAFTTVFIAFGWLAANFSEFLLGSSGSVSIALILQTISVIFIAKYYSPKKNIPLKKTLSLTKNIYNSWKWLIHMALVPGGLYAIIAYFFSETAFYQVYLHNELPNSAFGMKISGTLMGLAYLLGITCQSATYPSDKACVKFGTSFSLSTLVAIVFFNLILKINFIDEALSPVICTKILGFLQFFFAFGFGFFVPALFSIISENIHSDHFGRLFGVIETTDTISLSVSEKIIDIKNKFFSSNLIMSMLTLLLFFTSFLVYCKFLRVFNSYEEAEKN